MIDVNRVLALGRQSSLSVGIGLSEASMRATMKQLDRAGSRLRVTRFDDAKTLVSSLKRCELDAAVRGTLSSSKILHELKAQFALKSVMRTAVLEDIRGKQFLLTPVGIDEGMDRGSRIALAKATLTYLAPVGWDLSIGVLSKGREEDLDRGAEIRSSLKDGEEIAKALVKDGHVANHCTILIEEAVREHDLIIAPDGVVGNLIFRTLHFVGGGRTYGAPIVNLPKVFVDTSRAKEDFSDSLTLAAGLAKLRSSAYMGP